MADLVKVSPCPHGKVLSVTHVPEGSVVYDPACSDRQRRMKPHLAGSYKAGRKPRTSKKK